MEIEFEVPCGENERFAPGCFDTSIGKTYSVGKIVGARYDSGRVFLRIELSDPAVAEAIAADAVKGLSMDEPSDVVAGEVGDTDGDSEHDRH